MKYFIYTLPSDLPICTEFHQQRIYSQLFCDWRQMVRPGCRGMDQLYRQGRSWHT